MLLIPRFALCLMSTPLVITMIQSLSMIPSYNFNFSTNKWNRFLWKLSLEFNTPKGGQYKQLFTRKIKYETGSSYPILRLISMAHTWLKLYIGYNDFLCIQSSLWEWHAGVNLMTSQGARSKWICNYSSPKFLFAHKCNK